MYLTILVSFTPRGLIKGIVDEHRESNRGERDCCNHCEKHAEIRDIERCELV